MLYADAEVFLAHEVTAKIQEKMEAYNKMVAADTDSTTKKMDVAEVETHL